MKNTELKDDVKPTTGRSPAPSGFLGPQTLLGKDSSTWVPGPQRGTGLNLPTVY